MSGAALSGVAGVLDMDLIATHNISMIAADLPHYVEGCRSMRPGQMDGTQVHVCYILKDTSPPTHIRHPDQSIQVNKAAVDDYCRSDQGLSWQEYSESLMRTIVAYANKHGWVTFASAVTAAGLVIQLGFQHKDSAFVRKLLAGSLGLLRPATKNHMKPQQRNTGSRTRMLAPIGEDTARIDDFEPSQQNTSSRAHTLTPMDEDTLSDASPTNTSVTGPRARPVQPRSTQWSRRRTSQRGVGHGPVTRSMGSGNGPVTRSTTERYRAANFI